MNNNLIKTLKAAREAGLKTKDQWLKYTERRDAEYPLYFCPQLDATPIEVKGKYFYSREDCELCVSKKEASRRDLSIPKDAEPVAERYSQQLGGHYDLYRLSDCIPKRKPKPPKEVDLLLAIFTVNKSAKMYRDVSQTHYHDRRHGLAGDARERKDNLYELKDRGIAYAVRESRLHFVGAHGTLALYSGES